MLEFRDEILPGGFYFILELFRASEWFDYVHFFHVGFFFFFFKYVILKMMLRVLFMGF